MAKEPVKIETRDVEGVLVEGKNCCRCKGWKSLLDYNKDKNRVTGYSARCKKCECEVRAEYRKKNREKTNEYSRKYYEENKEYFMGVQRENRKDNKDVYNAYKQVRRARKRNLPDTLTREQIEIIMKRFNGKCALTGSVDYELDHFVAISTGHGGTTFENMIPLSRTLNASKNDSNPFEWFESNRERFALSEITFLDIVNYLSEINDMSLDEYKRYVYDCYNEKRRQVV